jgi:hypothetical protein
VLEVRAITVCVPFSALLVLPDEDPRKKRVENRDWFSRYVGELLIHAGKSREWLKYGDFDLEPHEMVFGAIVGVCYVEGTALITPQFDTGRRVWPNIVDDKSLARWPWLEYDEHASGRYGMVTCRNVKFPEPILYRGAQGFFDVPREVVAEQLAAVGWMQDPKPERV